MMSKTTENSMTLTQLQSKGYKIEKDMFKKRLFDGCSTTAQLNRIKRILNEGLLCSCDCDGWSDMRSFASSCIDSGITSDDYNLIDSILPS